MGARGRSPRAYSSTLCGLEGVFLRPLPPPLARRSFSFYKQYQGGTSKRRRNHYYKPATSSFSLLSNCRFKRIRKKTFFLSQIGSRHPTPRSCAPRPGTRPVAMRAPAAQASRSAPHPARPPACTWQAAPGQLCPARARALCGMRQSSCRTELWLMPPSPPLEHTHVDLAWQLYRWTARIRRGTRGK